MLIILYSILATIILHYWSINAPVGILILGFVIFLSNAMLGSRYIVRVTLAAILILISTYTLDYTGIHHPDRSALALEPTLGDIATYATLFSIFALIAWISSRLREQNLMRALSAEKALQNEKDTLAARLEEQTQVLRKAQQEEMLQLYQFAELGQLTTVILHDLANNLSVLSLDIDDLKEENNTSATINRTKESINYLEDMVTKVRRHINKNYHNKEFDVGKVILETISELNTKAAKANVHLVYRRDKIKASLTGDPLRLKQVLGILINNAIEATPSNNMTSKVEVHIKRSKGVLEISVMDQGVGIPYSVREDLFEPLRSTKETGLGMGLFVAKQIIITHFKGHLSLDPNESQTTFIVNLPRS